MEGPDEEADEGGLLGELGTNDGTGMWESNVAAFEQNLLEKLRGQAVQCRLALHGVGSHDFADGLFGLSARAESVAGRVQPLGLLLLFFLLLLHLLDQLQGRRDVACRRYWCIPSTSEVHWSEVETHGRRPRKKWIASLEEMEREKTVTSRSRAARRY
jgi:hypothetical protein